MLNASPGAGTHLNRTSLTKSSLLLTTFLQQWIQNLFGIHDSTFKLQKLCSGTMPAKCSASLWVAFRNLAKSVDDSVPCAQ